MRRGPTPLPFDALTPQEQDKQLAVDWPLRYWKRAWQSAFLDKPELKGVRNPYLAEWVKEAENLRKDLPTYFAQYGHPKDVCLGVGSLLFALEERLSVYGSPLTFLERAASKFQSSLPHQGEPGQPNSTDLVVGNARFINLYRKIAANTPFAEFCYNPNPHYSVLEARNLALASVRTDDHHLLSSDFQKIWRACKDASEETLKQGVVIFTTNSPKENTESTEIAVVLPQLLAARFVIEADLIQSLDATSNTSAVVKQYSENHDEHAVNIIVLPEAHIVKAGKRGEKAALYKTFTPGLVIAPKGKDYMDLEAIFGK